MSNNCIVVDHQRINNRLTIVLLHTSIDWAIDVYNQYCNSLSNRWKLFSIENFRSKIIWCNFVENLHTITMNYLNCLIKIYHCVNRCCRQFIEKLIKIFEKIDQNVLFRISQSYIFSHILLLHYYFLFVSFSYVYSNAFFQIIDDRSIIFESRVFFCRRSITLSSRLRSFSFASQSFFFLHHFISFRILLVIINNSRFNRTSTRTFSFSHSCSFQYSRVIFFQSTHWHNTIIEI